MTNSLLLSEIQEQPAVLRRLLAQESDHVAHIAAQIRAYDPRYVLIAARGTSDNAARYAQYLFGAHNHLAVMLAAPALYTQYHTPPRMDGALVIGISQSGVSPDLIAVMEEGKRQGCPTLAITNVRDSPMARVADETILLHAKRERSVAATKTYTAQLLALAMLSAALSRDERQREQLLRVPAQVESVLVSLSRQTARPAFLAVVEGLGVGALKSTDRCVVIARGFNYATAHEIGLKVQELARVVAEPYSAADFLHGPIALVEQGFPAIVINPSGKVFDEVQEVLVEIKRRGAQSIVISDRAEALAQSVAPIALPADIPEWLSPLVAIVPGQLLAYHLSRARGFDPDQPLGIQKVTRTI